MNPVRPLAYADANRARFLEELKALVRFPSISGQPRHAEDVKRCAVWLTHHLRRIGLEQAQLLPTSGHPLVYAEWRHAPGRPTVLLYGHYDVQPAEPLEAWKSPPFAPVVRNGNLYGRGACDDKGQLFAHLKAIESWLQTEGALPVNVKCLFEGEEETGSAHLKPFVRRNRHALQADMAVMSDTRMLGPGRPALTYAMRGQLGLELEVRSGAQEVHSGNFGGAIHNAVQALVEILAGLHDEEGRVAIPGFYNRVRLWNPRERRYMRRNGPSDRKILQDAKGQRNAGEDAYTLYERTTIRPALTFNGISGGYEGVGGKAVIPPSALAKVSFRLVPDQDPREIEALFRKHIARIAPANLRISIRSLLSAEPVVLPRDHPALRAAVEAYRKGFGVAPVFLRSGGTIPVVATILKELAIPTALMGFALPDDGMHAPNEKFALTNFYCGIATCLWFLAEAGHVPLRYGLPYEGTSENAPVPMGVGTV